MNHVKTNEEYKFFKGRKKSSIGNWDITNAPENKRDPDEPFFNKNKPTYLRKKRDEEVLKELGIPTDNWNSFIRTLSKRFYLGSDPLWSERGTKGVDPGSYYYRVNLDNSDEGPDSTLYLFPKEKKIVVIYYAYDGSGSRPKSKNKKIFEYHNNNIVLVLNEIINYLFSLKEDPDVFRKKMKDEYDLQKQRKYKELLYTDDELEEPEPDEDIQQATPKEIPSHRKINRNAPDTAAFDSFNHVQSFQMFESGMPDTLKHYKRDGIMNKLKPIKKRLKKEYNKIAKNPLNRFDMPVMSEELNLGASWLSRHKIDKDLVIDPDKKEKIISYLLNLENQPFRSEQVLRDVPDWQLKLWWDEYKPINLKRGLYNFVSSIEADFRDLDTGWENMGGSYHTNNKLDYDRRLSTKIKKKLNKLGTNFDIKQ